MLPIGGWKIQFFGNLYLNLEMKTYHLYFFPRNRFHFFSKLPRTLKNIFVYYFDLYLKYIRKELFETLFFFYSDFYRIKQEIKKYFKFNLGWLLKNVIFFFDLAINWSWSFFGINVVKIMWNNSIIYFFNIFNTVFWSS